MALSSSIAGGSLAIKSRNYTFTNSSNQSKHHDEIETE
jgi:hypothetical protein